MPPFGVHNHIITHSVVAFLQPFGSILNLVPLAESVVKLNAVCMQCFKEAAYTKRIGAEKEVRRQNKAPLDELTAHHLSQIIGLCHITVWLLVFILLFPLEQKISPEILDFFPVKTPTLVTIKSPRRHFPTPAESDKSLRQFGELFSHFISCVTGQ